MRMTLTTSNNNSANNNEKSSDDRPVSPNSSPRSSPKISSIQSQKQKTPEQAKSDILLLTVCHNKDGSHSSNDSSLNSRSLENSLESSQNITKSENSGPKRTKKKSSWFTAFYPTYKSKSCDFKKLFKDVPDDERLVVDYSCALQKEILHQGRLYVTQNYLCFYANIFGWETNVQLKWKDVATITKEKTALVFPNAVLICTRNENYFFTSFIARDKVYVILFRVWQNALMDQPMTSREMWQLVHQCYGDELGLTSDDEDYIAPGTEDDKLSSRLSVESFSEECGSTDNHEIMATEEKLYINEIEFPSTSSIQIGRDPRRTSSDSRLPRTDLSDTTESDIEKSSTKNKIFCNDLFLSNLPFPNIPDSDCLIAVINKCENGAKCIKCTSTHEGRQLLNEIIPIHIDQLFTLLFTSSKFYLDFHASRKTTDLTQTPWTHNPTDNTKSRVVNLTVALNQTMGPKTAQVTESQMMLSCSKAGTLYAVDVDTLHAGIPYADSFYILVHYCLQKISETESSLAVYAQVKYKKSVWGLVKGMIEKNCWSGLEDFFSSLLKHLHIEAEENVPDIKRKSRRKRRIHTLPRQLIKDSRLISNKSRVQIVSGGVFSSDLSTIIVLIVLILLVMLNVLLYYKLWSLEKMPPYTLMDLHILKDPPKSHDEWIKLLQQQETLHSVEIQKWQRILRTSIQLLKQTEDSLNELQKVIDLNYSSKFLAILQNHKDIIDKQEEL